MATSRNPESVFGPYARRAAGAARLAWAASAAYVLAAVVAIVMLVGCGDGARAVAAGDPPAAGRVATVA